MSTAPNAHGRGRRPWRLVIAVVVLVAGLAVVASALALPAFLRGMPAGQAMDAPRFVEEASAAGIEQVYDGAFTFFTGGGVAVLDCDEDGRPDMYLAGGANPAALYHNESDIAGGLRFSHPAAAATDMTDVTGAYPLDVDSDGLTDLAVLRSGENVMLRGLGDCRFERANEAWGIDGGDDWTTAFSAAWEGQAALPTMVFGNYLALDELGEPGDTCADHDLFRPAAGSQTYDPPTALTPGWCTLSVLFSDWDRSGRRDLRVSNDRHYTVDGVEQLWRFAAGEAPRTYSAEEGWARLRIWGMGIASQDLTGDGRPEIYLTSQGDNKLQTLEAGAIGPTYHDIALLSGATAHRPFTGDVTKESTAWHAEFQDVNNDGFIDLFVTKGNVDAMPDYAAQDPSNLLMGQADGTFVEGAEAAGIVTFAKGRGAALVDFNLDGLLDIVEVTREENVKLWRSVGAGDESAAAPMGHWAAIRLEQPAPNADAIGAWVSVKVGERIIERELTVGGGHAGGQLGWMHVGLGPSEAAEVRVQWPDGEVGPWMALPADGFSIVERGADSVRPWTPTAE